jgi:hypothetical protein
MPNQYFLQMEPVRRCKASLALVAMEGITHEVGALISNGPAVVGGALLKRFGYKLIVDYKDNSVVLEK